MYATINGTRLFFDVEGSGLKEIEGSLQERPSIIALHGGLGFDHGYLREGIGPLSDIAQVIYVDLRGHGRSGRPAVNTLSLEQMADDIAELSGRLGLRNPYILGHSAGGFVAMLLTLRHPELAGGLVLVNSSAAVSATVSEIDEPAPVLADRASPSDMEIAASVFSGDITPESVADFFHKVGPFYAAPGHEELPGRLLRATTMNVDVMRHFVVNLAPNYDLNPFLRYINIPVLLLVGAHDWVCPPRASRAIAASIANSVLVEFHNSGHFPFCEEPEKFRTAVHRFIASTSSD